MQGTDTAILGIKLAFSLAAVVLIVVLIVRPMWRMLGTKPDILDSLNQVAQMPLEEEEELQIPTDGAKPDRGTLIQEAKNDPNRTAMLISSWLKDSK